MSLSSLLPSLVLATSVAVGPAAASDLALPFERYRLDNGLEVILHEDHRTPTVAVDLWIHVGAGDEAPGKTGFAHLFEHMMFQGSRNVPEEKHFEVLRTVGASMVNGTTSFDRTNYFEVVPANQLETALWLESDRLGLLLDRVNEASLRNQIDVVRNERRQRYDNVPYGAARLALFEEAYPEGHPYRHLVIGKHEDLEAASLEDVRRFFRAWYTPANATLVIAGDIRPAEVKTLVQKWFGGLPSTPAPAHRAPPMPRLTEHKRREVSDAFARLPRIQMAWHAPPRYAADDVDLATLADVLGQPGWGRLYKRLVVERQLAQNVAVWVEGMGFSSLFNIGVTLKPGVDPAEVEALVRRELVTVFERGPSGAEVRRSVVDTETNILFSLDELLNRAEQLQAANHYTKDPGAIVAYLAEVRSRTPQTVREAARRWLAKPRVTIVTIPAPPAPPPAPAPTPAAPSASTTSSPGAAR